MKFDFTRKTIIWTEAEKKRATDPNSKESEKIMEYIKIFGADTITFEEAKIHKKDITFEEIEQFIKDFDQEHLQEKLAEFNGLKDQNASYGSVRKWFVDTYGIEDIKKYRIGLIMQKAEAIAEKRKKEAEAKKESEVNSNE